MENTLTLKSKEMIDFTMEYAEMLGVTLTPETISFDEMELAS